MTPEPSERSHLLGRGTAPKNCRKNGSSKNGLRFSHDPRGVDVDHRRRDPLDHGREGKLHLRGDDGTCGGLARSRRGNGSAEKRNEQQLQLMRATNRSRGMKRLRINAAQI